MVERCHILNKCKKKDKGGVYFICTHHKTESITKTQKFNRNGKDQSFKVTFDAPEGLSVKAQQSLQQTRSRGSAIDPAYRRNANKITSDISHLSNTNDTLANAAADNAALVMETYQIIDKLSAKNNLLKNQNEKYKKVINNYKIGKATISPASIKPSHKSNQIKITYKEMENNDNEVRRRTGFKLLNHLLAFVIIVCNGNHDAMTYKASKLTWQEEWFFEF